MIDESQRRRDPGDVGVIDLLRKRAFHIELHMPDISQQCNEASSMRGFRASRVKYSDSVRLRQGSFKMAFLGVTDTLGGSERRLIKAPNGGPYAFHLRGQT